MLSALLDRLFAGRSLSRLEPTRRVTLHGIRFTIRKLNPLDYLVGAKALKQSFATYESAREASKMAASGALNEKDVTKVKDHYRDVLMAGVVSVRLHGKEYAPAREEKGKAEAGKIPVANLMTDWALAEEIYAAIVAFTYGKKKHQITL